jgi:(R,R)-butanediol dehydrogenase/meso-butanediol dehydrogenase/diacetyl reductase
MSASSMRAVSCVAPGALRVGSLPLPAPGPGEVRVRVRACGICGSDLSLLPMGYLGRQVVPGHEMAGEVDALGDGVALLAPGDAVAVEPLHSCGRCSLCREGRDAICPQVQVYGVHRNGGLAEHVVVPARRLFRLPPGLAPCVAALAEPMAVVVHGLRRAGLRAGQRLLVLGAGTLGLLGALAARELGAGSVWLTARYDHQAALGAALGAERVLREPEATPEALAALARERPFDAVLETIGGVADSVALALHALRAGGSVAVVGLHRSPVSVPPYLAFLKEATLAWSNCYQRAHRGADFDEAVRILGAHRESLSRVTTHQVGLEEAARGFELAGAKAGGVIKVTVLV